MPKQPTTRDPAKIHVLKHTNQIVQTRVHGKTAIERRALRTGVMERLRDRRIVQDSAAGLFENKGMEHRRPQTNERDLDKRYTVARHLLRDKTSVIRYTQPDGHGNEERRRLASRKAGRLGIGRAIQGRARDIFINDGADQRGNVARINKRVRAGNYRRPRPPKKNNTD